MQPNSTSLLMGMRNAIVRQLEFHKYRPLLAAISGDYNGVCGEGEEASAISMFSLC